MNALDAARLGMTGTTHVYGLFEALYEDHDVQTWAAHLNYANEYDRFSQVARQWTLITPQGSELWNAVLEEFLECDYIINSTMTIYAAGWNVEFARTSPWHEKYTLHGAQLRISP